MSGDGDQFEKEAKEYLQQVKVFLEDLKDQKLKPGFRARRDELYKFFEENAYWRSIDVDDEEEEEDDNGDDDNIYDTMGDDWDPDDIDHTEDISSEDALTLTAHADMSGWLIKKKNFMVNKRRWAVLFRGTLYLYENHKSEDFEAKFSVVGGKFVEGSKGWFHIAVDDHNGTEREHYFQEADAEKFKEWEEKFKYSFVLRHLPEDPSVERDNSWMYDSEEENLENYNDKEPEPYQDEEYDEYDDPDASGGKEASARQEVYEDEDDEQTKPRPNSGPKPPMTRGHSSFGSDDEEEEEEVRKPEVKPIPKVKPQPILSRRQSTVSDDDDDNVYDNPDDDNIYGNDSPPTPKSKSPPRFPVPIPAGPRAQPFSQSEAARTPPRPHTPPGPRAPSGPGTPPGPRAPSGPRIREQSANQNFSHLSAHKQAPPPLPVGRPKPTSSNGPSPQPVRKISAAGSGTVQVQVQIRGGAGPGVVKTAAKPGPRPPVAGRRPSHQGQGPVIGPPTQVRRPSAPGPATPPSRVQSEAARKKLNMMKSQRSVEVNPMAVNNELAAVLARRNKNQN